MPSPAARIEQRRRRAREETFTIHRLPAGEGEPPGGGLAYRVQGASGRAYRVELWPGPGGAARCTCRDFLTSGLGTCKHVEAVRLTRGEAEGPVSPRPARPRAARPRRPVAELAADPRADVVFFDLETRRLFGEVGGPQHAERLGLAVAVTYSGGEGYRTYLEEDARALVDRLVRADLVVGFNVVGFDYRVLEAYGGPQVFGAPTLDLLVEVRRAAGLRVSLSALARATLGRDKTADGVQAVRWFREGQVDRVAGYCREDVALTRALFEHGLRCGHLRCTDKTGQVREVPALWARRPVGERRAAPGGPAL